MFRKIEKYVSRSTNHIAKLVSACVMCMGFCSAALAIDLSTISQVIFFGDSLTDSGFNDLWTTQGNPPTVPPLPAGKAPTFTTFGAFTWSQWIAHDIKGFQFPIYPGPVPSDTITNNSIEFVPGFVSSTLHGINYAAAGSTTNSTGFQETWAPSLHQQVIQYLASIPNGQRLDPNAVFFVWSGANDFLVAISGPTFPTQLELLRTANTAAINIGNQVALLSSRGAKRIVVISLPNFGLSPLAINAGPAAQESLKTISFTFNSMLNTQLGHVVRRYGTKILFVDVYDLLSRVINLSQMGKPYVIGGQSFLFGNVTSPACTPSAIYCPPTAPTNFLFADLVHPSGEAHRLISLQVETLMQQWA